MPINQFSNQTNFKINKYFQSSLGFSHSFNKLLLYKKSIFLNKYLFNFFVKFTPNLCNFLVINEITSQIFVNLSLQNLISFLKIIKYYSDLHFECLTDICAVDYTSRIKRFSVFYNFLSIYLNIRLFVFLNISETESLISVNSLFSSANWLEREIWDLFGIFFIGHLDLRRILTDYGFDGFALRKDFPLTGYVEVYYNEEDKLISYTPLELTQEYRFFDFETPWEYK